MAIPSHNRPEILNRKTLAMLERHHIDKERIHIFVSSDVQKGIYESANPGYKIITAELGIVNVRNFITNYFSVGQPIMSFDDDITEIKQKSGTKLIVIDDLHAFILNGFAVCERNGVRMFGVYPVANGMFMKDYIREDLQLIVGGAYGIINPGSELRVSIEYKEDYERCILMYLKDGGTIRFDYITLVTGFYKGAGGLVDSRTKQNVEESAKALLTKYPDYVKLKKSTKLGYMEVSLKCKSV